MSSASGISLLHKLAHLYRVQTAYYDVAHRRRPAPAESLLAVLRALGAHVETFNDVASAWRQRRQELWQRLLEPVTVAWHGEPPLVDVRLPSYVVDSTLVGHLTLETGEQQTYEWQTANLQLVKYEEVEGISYVVKRVPLPVVLPWGYHRFTLEASGMSAETLIIVAPVRAYASSNRSANRVWGAFLPLYALSTETSWGSGDFSSLETLIEWVAGLGGHVVATLPLLATFLDKPFEPSPYAPVSRLLWNEFYLDIAKVPDLPKCLSAQALLASPSFQGEIDALRYSAYVDYRRVMALKRQVLEKLCQSFFAEASDRLNALHRFIEANPLVEEYARFRATLEKERISWRAWPGLLRQGELKQGDYNEKDRRYHLYVQWLIQQQIQACSRKAQERGVQLYFDLPLGVHPDGYDVWRERDAFASDVSVGAPPDAVFTRGQNWDFPPLHPEEIRKQGYRYTVAYLRHHLQYASILRVDHVMALHRLYWIPKGLPPSQGVYVRYQAEELYAILALESHRNKSIIVGEDLGTVPREVRPAMVRHGLHRMYVMHYELESNVKKALRSVSNNYVASLNTHDMPPFAAFWQGMDIKERLELGLLDKASARSEWNTRQTTQKDLVTFLKDKGWIKEPTSDVYAILKACLMYLSTSQARVVLVNLEDLWLETQPQNVPSSGQEYPNWRRKAHHSIEAFCQMHQVVDILKEVDRLRKHAPVPHDV